MAYPDKINALVDVSADETLAAGGHAARHNDVNEALEEVRDFLGTGTGYRYADTVYFTSSGTFTKASYPWLRAIRVRVVGAGGGGGGAEASSATGSSEGSGGSGGGYAEKFITDIAGLSASETVTVGAGGSGGAAGNNDGSTGGNSAAFGMTGFGGQRGDGGADTTSTTYAFGRQGGAGSGGDLDIQGSSGGPGIVVDASNDVCGIHNFGGATVLAGSSFVASSNTNGIDGREYGGGGMGGRNRNSSNAAKSGGDGANGIVIVELYA